MRLQDFAKRAATKRWWPVVDFLRESVTQWSQDRAPMLGAALSYYSVFSMGPLLLIVIAIAGFFFGKQEARQEVFGLLSGAVGPQGAQALSLLLESAFRPGHGVVAAIGGLGSLVMGAAGVFGQVQDALNIIWRTPPRPGRGLWSTVVDQALQVLMVLVAGLLILLAMLASAILSAFRAHLGAWMPDIGLLWHVAQLGISFGVLTSLFALAFKYLPNLRLCWRDVWIGALGTALLFMIGDVAVGLYLAFGAPSSIYGAASSLVAFMLWVYYSAQVFFFGVEMTKVYSHRYGSLAESPPPEHAPGP